ncbi:MAG: hypothetical protein M0T84_16755 [Betaproteobacteria bacterium]|nr:hypothetical protein [Betaproteobacteria bacterium]
MKMTLKHLCVLALGLAAAASVQASDLLKPFILASNAPGNMAAQVAQTKAALQKAGFTLAGSYSPYAGATVVCVTNAEMLHNATLSPMGGFGAAERVALTQVGSNIQVSYVNPVYMANAYRMKDTLEPVAAKLKTALGDEQAFGAHGLTASQLRRYHYMFGMEYFTDPSVLATYPSYQAAVAAVQANLRAGKGGVSEVYRIDIPGAQQTEFGVAMRAGPGGNKSMDDHYIMSQIDFRPIKSTAHLPYEMLVDGNKVLALYARFRIAIDFPDLAMIGAHSFVNIMSSPEAIRKALVVAAGGKERKNMF